MYSKLLTKHQKMVQLIRYIRIMSFFGFTILLLFAAKELYVREKDKTSLLEEADKQLVILLSQYESAIKLSESLDKGSDIKFINKLLSYKEDFPKIKNIDRTYVDDEVGVVEGNSIKFSLGANNKPYHIDTSHDELLFYLLSKIKADEWFSIRVESNSDRNQIKYNGVNTLVFLLDLIFDHEVKVTLFCFAVILFFTASVSKAFVVDVTGAIKVQDKKIKDFEQNEKQTIGNIQNLQECQKVSKQTIYLLFNRAISNNVNSFDKEEVVNLATLVQEAISLLMPLCSEKNITINTKETNNLSIKIVSREILLVIVLNYIYRSIIRSSRNAKVKVTLAHGEKERLTLKIIDKGYFYIEQAAGETSDIFCLPQELLILLAKKLGIEVVTSKTNYNITSININKEAVEELGKNNVIALKN